MPTGSIKGVNDFGDDDFIDISSDSTISEGNDGLIDDEILKLDALKDNLAYMKELDEMLTETDRQNDVELQNKESPHLDQNDTLKSKAEAIAFKEKGNTAYKNGNLAEAENFYRMAISLAPKSEKHITSTFLSNLAAVLLLQCKYTETVDTCTEALVYDNRNIKALVRRAKANKNICSSESLESALEDIDSIEKLVKSKSATEEEIKYYNSVKDEIDILNTEIRKSLLKARTEGLEDAFEKLKATGKELFNRLGINFENVKLEKTNNGGYSVST